MKSTKIVTWIGQKYATYYYTHAHKSKQHTAEAIMKIIVSLMHVKPHSTMVHVCVWYWDFTLHIAWFKNHS